MRARKVYALGGLSALATESAKSRHVPRREHLLSTKLVKAGEIVVRVREVGIGKDGLLIAANGFVDRPLIFENDTEVEASDGMVREEL